VNVPSEEAGVAGRRCQTCRQTKADAEFYAGCAECKPCKRDRSKRNRGEQAQKLEVVERLIDVLAAIAARTIVQPSERAADPVKAVALDADPS
jgi:hypothetical protein